MISRFTKYFTLSTIVALCFTGLLPSGVAYADTIGEQECFPAVLMLRGSGEEPLITDGEPGFIYKSSTENPLIRTNGSEGPILGRLLKQFALETDPSKTVSKVRFIGIEYPALPVFPEIPAYVTETGSGLMYALTMMNHIIKYDDSYRKGAEMTASFIKEDQERGCETKYMLLSYSQGVIAARLAMNLLNNDTEKIISSYVIGDPFQKADGVISSEQKTNANTSSNTQGVGVSVSNTIAGSMGYVNSLFYQPLIEGIESYVEEMKKSDALVYRNDTDTGVVSRALCHENDPTCGVTMLDQADIQRHLSYFDPASSEGSQDLALEIEEFDNQVQTLANTTTNNPRERTLVKTPSISGNITSYNVVNTRSNVYNSSGVLVSEGDKCSWDEGSNGTEEAVDISCGIYNAVHSGDSAKMTVTVTDTFGIEYVYTLDTPTIDGNTVDKLTGLDPNQWYQFIPYKQPNTSQKQCLQFATPSAFSSIPESDYSIGASLKKCEETPSLSKVESGYQVFKSIPYQTLDEGLHNRIVWGYDDNYSWYNENEWGNTLITPMSLNSGQDIAPILSQIIDGKPYYIFSYGESCLNVASDTSIFMDMCAPPEPSQLFEASPVTGNFGNFSIERDIIPPGNIENLHIELGSSVSLKWDLVSDDRDTWADSYDVYKKNPTTGEMDLLGNRQRNYYTFPLFEQVLSDWNEFEVVAVDRAGNRSPIPTSLSFANVDYSTVPLAAPKVESLSQDGTKITLSLPSASSNDNVRIFNSWNTVGNITGSTSVQTITLERYYRWTYQIELAPNVYTERSLALDFSS